MKDISLLWGMNVKLEKSESVLSEDVIKDLDLVSFCNYLGKNDQDLNPCEVQLISLNRDEFKGNENAILKSFITCFAGSMANSLLKSNNGVDPMMKALTRRVEELLSVIVKDMRISLSKYVDISGESITKLILDLTEGERLYLHRGLVYSTCWHRQAFMYQQNI